MPETDDMQECCFTFDTCDHSQEGLVVRLTAQKSGSVPGIIITTDSTVFESNVKKEAYEAFANLTQAQARGLRDFLSMALLQPDPPPEA
jgi:hypothetical protein